MCNIVENNVYRVLLEIMQNKLFAVNKCYMPIQRMQQHNYLQYLFQTSAAFA